MIYEDGTAQQLATPLTVSANSRTTIEVGGVFPSAVGRRFGVIVESLGSPAAQLVVERALYNDATILGQRVTWADGACRAGWPARKRGPIAARSSRRGGVRRFAGRPGVRRR